MEILPLTPNLQLSREPPIFCPPRAPWSIPSYSISHQLSFPCSRNDPPYLCKAVAILHLFSLPHSEITDGSVPGRLGEGGSGIHIKCTKCITATSHSFSAALWATNYSADTYAILYALEWCISHSASCAFETVTFFSDSLSVLSTLSAPLPYLISKSLTDTQSLLNTLSDCKVPGHSPRQ